MPKTRLPLVPLAFALFGMTGCGRTTTTTTAAEEYNNSISKSTKDLERIVLDFDKALDLCNGDAAKLKEAHAKCISDAASLIQAGRSLEAPELLHSKEFHDAFLEYLRAQEKIINEEFSQLVQSISENNVEALKAQASRLRQYEYTYLRILRGAEAKFAHAHNLQIK